MNHRPKDNQPGTALAVGLLGWMLIGSGCLAAPASDPHRISQGRAGAGDVIFGIAGPDPATYADRLPPCERLDSPLSACTPESRCADDDPLSTADSSSEMCNGGLAE